MMGLEPTTYCMARTGGRSRSIACVRQTGLRGGLRGARRTSPNPAEPRVQPLQRPE
jgi:hypothetical protein